LLLGLLFGAQIGAKLGARGAADRARNEEMDRLGVTQEMLDAAEECGLALQQSMEGLKATQSSLDTHQSLARILDRDATELYEKAKEAMASGNEEAARTALLRRNENQEKLKKVLKLCAEEKKRFEMMERNVEAIEQRALEVESLLQRTVGAKARQDASFADLSLSVEDPLLKKFRDLGID
jgi:phage shock protein A